MIRLLVLIVGVLVWALIRLVPGLAPVAVSLPGGACSENAAYAKALVALDWLAEHPPATVYAQQYSHAVLDALYDRLVDEGSVAPAPPACVVAARIPAAIYARPDRAAERTGALRAGDSADIYGRSADGAWWYIASRTGYGWISARAVVVQPSADVSLIPLRE